MSCKKAVLRGGMYKLLVCALIACAAGKDGRTDEGTKELVLDYDLYGKMHISAERQDNGEDSDFYLSSNSSRIGLKGLSELEDGIELIWQVESGVNVDESGSTFATRNSFAGLSSKRLGTVLGGHHDSPYKIIGRKADLFGDRIGDSRNIIGVTDHGCDLRLKNVVMYKTPAFAGLEGVAAYGAEEETEDTDVVSASLIYAAGNGFLGIAFEEHGGGLTAIDTDGDGVGDAVSDAEESGCRLVGGYAVKGMTVNVLYEVLDDVDGLNGSDCSAMGVGIKYKAEKNIFKVQFYSRDSVDAVPDSGADMLVVGVDRKLGDNAVVYLAYAAVDNEEFSTIRMSGGGHGDKVAPSAGDDPSGIAVGLIYSF